MCLCCARSHTGRAAVAVCADVGRQSATIDCTVSVGRRRPVTIDCRAKLSISTAVPCGTGGEKRKSGSSQFPDVQSHRAPLADSTSSASIVWNLSRVHRLEPLPRPTFGTSSAVAVTYFSCSCFSPSPSSARSFVLTRFILRLRTQFCGDLSSRTAKMEPGPSSKRSRHENREGELVKMDVSTCSTITFKNIT